MVIAEWLEYFFFMRMRAGAALLNNMEQHLSSVLISILAQTKDMGGFGNLLIYYLVYWCHDNGSICAIM